MKYELLVLDVDGTLVGTDNIVPAETARAVRNAEQAGYRICLATGRSYSETLPVWRQLELAGPHEPMVIIGGALVSEADSGRSLYHKPIAYDAACRFSDILGEAGYCAMAIIDKWRHDVEYFVTESGDVEDAERRWFSKMDVKVRRVSAMSEVGSLPEIPEILRISTVVEPENADALIERLRSETGDQTEVHAIVAPNYGVMIVEAHAAGANKRTAVNYVAQASGTPFSRVVAVGDDINDISILSAAGLGAAMAKAPDSVLAAADVVATDGLAEFIDRLVVGEFDD